MNRAEREMHTAYINEEHIVKEEVRLKQDNLILDNLHFWSLRRASADSKERGENSAVVCYTLKSSIEEIVFFSRRGSISHKRGLM